MSRAKLKPEGVILIALFALVFAALGVYKLRHQLFPEPKTPGSLDSEELRRILSQGQSSSLGAAPGAGRERAAPGSPTDRD